MGVTLLVERGGETLNHPCVTQRPCPAGTVSWDTYPWLLHVASVSYSRWLNFRRECLQNKRLREPVRKHTILCDPDSEVLKPHCCQTLLIR